ncbi:BJ4_G0000020.mRNA.1.CDS.1 [Saccharomyces cerevisiae]|nr:BJ4_G0000020.mRNA.1.CDS.1 [Saccharomyces cerevisiae]
MKDNEIEDEKSVDVLSVKQLESQKTVLPQDVFRNELTWFCYEMSKSLAFRIWMLLWLPLSVWWKLSNNWILSLKASIFRLSLGLQLLWGMSAFSRRRALSKQHTQFSKEITKNPPSSDPHDWEVIAANLNSYFYENKTWNTKYFFFYLTLRRKRVLSTWKTFSSPRKFTDLSLPGSSKGSFTGGF